VQAGNWPLRCRSALATLLAIGLALLFSTLVPAPVLAATPPTVVAPQAILIDPDTGQVLFERDNHAHVAPASLTKVMTALVAIEHTDLGQQVTITQDDLIGEANMGLRTGQAVSLETLLYGLILPSGNDAAMAIARGVGAGSDDLAGAAAIARFVGWMNETAARLDLHDTHYVNPHGLDADDHYSSAYDLARLTGIAWRDPLFARIFGSQRYQAEGFQLVHSHRLVGNSPGVVGGKVGLTDGCGFCLITAAEHGDRRLVAVVLHDTVAQAYTDTITLLAWAYDQLDAGQFPSLVAALPSSPASPTPAPTTPAPPTTPTMTATPATPSFPTLPPATLSSTTSSTLTTSPPEQDRLRPLAIAVFALMLACGLVRRLWP
jgi:D-alanyl-D-alanine carboxypeptidase (penicillin-binding protein 5/6)